MGRMSYLPCASKPRERLLSLGAEALSTDELIALIIRSGTHGMDVLETASTVKEALKAGNATASSLMAIKGLGTGKASAVLAAMQLPYQLASEHEHSDLLSSDHVAEACRDIACLSQENLIVFYLSVRNRVLKRDLVSVGTLDASIIHPRDVFRPAILSNASKVLLAHNHPSGDPAPSSADLAATRSMAVAGTYLGIELVDHVIVAADSFISLRSYDPGLFNSQAA